MTFDVSGSCISFGHNNRIEWNLSEAIDLIDDFNTPIKDLNEDLDDIDLSSSIADIAYETFKNKISDGSQFRPHFKQGHDTLGFSIYHIFPKKAC